MFFICFLLDRHLHASLLIHGTELMSLRMYLKTNGLLIQSNDSQLNELLFCMLLRLLQAASSCIVDAESIKPYIETMITAVQKVLHTYIYMHTLNQYNPIMLLILLLLL
jgi:hypothetical protein